MAIDLEKEAKRVAREFRDVYRTPENPAGKRWVDIYGGKEPRREDFAKALRRELGEEVHVFDGNIVAIRGGIRRDSRVYQVDFASLDCSQ